MKIDKNKKQKELERVFLAPTLRPFLCLTVKDDTDVEDEFEIENEEKTARKKVQQTIHGRVFTTEIVTEQELGEDTSMREESKITYVLPIGTRLVWEEGEGYIATENKFQTIEEIEENYNLLKE